MSAHEVSGHPWSMRPPEESLHHGPVVSPRDILERVVCDVLGQLVGVSAHASTEPRPSVEQCLVAHVGMRGALAGVVSVAAPLALCVRMACAAMNHAAAAAEHVRAECALAEFANVTAGRLVLDMEPVEHTWLSPPAVLSYPLDEWAVLCGSHATACFEVDGMPLLVLANIRGSA